MILGSTICNLLCCSFVGAVVTHEDESRRIEEVAQGGMQPSLQFSFRGWDRDPIMSSEAAIRYHLPSDRWSHTEHTPTRSTAASLGNISQQQLPNFQPMQDYVTCTSLPPSIPSQPEWKRSLQLCVGRKALHGGEQKSVCLKGNLGQPSCQFILIHSPC